MIRLFLLGFKGYYLIKNIPDDYISLIDSVVIAKDSNVDNDFFDEIEKVCIKRNLVFYERNFEKKSDAEYYILIGWRWLMPIGNSVKVIVFHDSLLPKYRGFNPLVTALINGDERIGATCLFASDEYDKGEIICQEAIDIVYPIKIADAINLIAMLYYKLFLSFVYMIKNNSLKSFPQNESDSTYSLWRDDVDYYIDWKWDARKIEKFINAVGPPYLGARTFIKNECFIIKNAKAMMDVMVEDREQNIGKVIFKKENKLVVVCGVGLLEIDGLIKLNGLEYNIENKFRIRFS